MYDWYVVRWLLAVRKIKFQEWCRFAVVDRKYFEKRSCLYLYCRKLTETEEFVRNENIFIKSCFHRVLLDICLLHSTFVRFTLFGRIGKFAIGRAFLIRVHGTADLYLDRTVTVILLIANYIERLFSRIQIMEPENLHLSTDTKSSCASICCVS